MIEGIFGLIITGIYSYINNPFIEIKKFYESNDKNNFIILIICLILYFILSAGRNMYRILTNKLYSPMVWTLTDSISDPILNIYNTYFSNSNNRKEPNHFYFSIKLIISIIIVFCALVYNEFLILFCCGF